MKGEKIGEKRRSKKRKEKKQKEKHPKEKKCTSFACMRPRAYNHNLMEVESLHITCSMMGCKNLIGLIPHWHVRHASGSE